MGVSGEAMGVREVSAKYDLQVATSGVPVGYKQTEVGVLPEDWECAQICSLAKLESGHTPSRREPSYWNGCIPWVSLHDTAVIDGPEITTTAYSVTQKGIDNSSARLLPAGTVVFSRTATVGKTTILGKPMATSQDFANYICGPNLDSHYLVYLFRSMGKTWDSLMAGSTHKTIYMPTFQNLKIAVPPLPEQRAIATALSDMDALLDGLDRLIAKKRDLKQAAMQQLLTGQTRLAGFEGEWEVKTLEQLAEIRSGGTPSTSNPFFWDGEIPWCTPTDITALKGKKYLSCTARTISLTGLLASSAEIIPANSIIMTSRATIGECAINLLPMTTNQGFKNLIPHDEVDVEFLYYLMATQKERLIQLCGGSTFLEIGKRQLTSFEVIFPCDRNEQAAIATILSDMDSELESLEQRRSKTCDLKQAMMQELLTGRTRLIRPLDNASAENKTASREKKVNVHFRRSVLAAEIIDQLHEEPTFGHVKFEKILFLAEHLCEVDTGSTYRRQAAGPYDNRALRSIDSQLRKQQWFDARKEGRRYRYVPLGKQGGHKTYFDRYFSSISTDFKGIVETFRTFDTERCEIVATLFSAWSDLLREKGTVSDDMIVHEVLNNWHESKKRISEDRWRNALGWMREKGVVPKQSVSSEY